MSIVLFEDDRVRQLDPVAVGKPAFAISCGGYRLFDIVAALGVPAGVRVRPHLTDIVAADFPQFAAGSSDSSAPTLWINARLAALGQGARSIEGDSRSRTAGHRPHGDVGRRGARAGGIGLGDRARRAADATKISPLSGCRRCRSSCRCSSIRTTSSAITWRRSRPTSSIAWPQGGYQQLADGVFVAAGATLGQYCVTDTSKGPIVLDEGATIGPHCYLSGPVYVGPRARVLEHAALKDGVAIGYTAKIGGEVEASIIERYTNKQHHGFLGHSYLGSWINLGAGTCNSDLKNTYGQVNMEYHGQKVATGMQFVGAIIGDYAKTAINTGIFTGKTIGVCSMVYGFVTTNVPSFVNYARLFGQVSEAPVEVLISTGRRMFERRGVVQRPIDVQLLRDMHELTAHERQRTGETMSLEPLSL